MNEQMNKRADETEQLPSVPHSTRRGPQTVAPDALVPNCPLWLLTPLSSVVSCGFKR